MKTFSIIPIICFFLLSSCEHETEPKSYKIIENSRTIPEITKILFIGNSHTNRNNIPKTIQLMAASAGDSTYSHNETQPGYSLAWHCDREETMNTIDSLKWDFVVIQEQGAIQALPQSMIDSAVYQYTQILIDAIKNNNPNSIIILYMTHAYREGVLTFGGTDWAANEPQLANYDGMQLRIRDNYLEMSDIFNSEIAPAGILWKIFQDKYPNVNLFNADGIHALPNGSYLLACAIYSTIFRKSPVGKYIPEGINNEEAANMQNIVYQSQFKLNPDWSNYQ